MNVLLIGPPGSGKGTQGARLAERLGLRHIAAGDLLRKEVADQTPIGLKVAGYIDRGELVPDDVIIELVLPAVRDAITNGNGYLLDGFPRSVEQAELVRHIVDDEDASADHAIYLDAPREELIKRILARAEVEGRADDNEATVANRLQVFENETRPLVDYYEGRGVLRHVDAHQAADDVTEQILAALEVEPQ
jgi:adenylate kinase